MKILTGLIGSSVLLFASLSLANNRPVIENAAKYIDKVFVPAGFVDNDNVEIIISGQLRDTCYQPGEAKYKIDEKKKIIFLEATVLNYTHERITCLEVLTPFVFKIGVGILNAGNYKIILKSPKISERKIFELEISQG